MRRSSFIFKENYLFIEEDNRSDKVVMIEEELDGIDRDGIGILVDLPRILFVDEECGNLKVVVDGGEFTRNNNRKKRSKICHSYNRYNLCAL